jgi:SAM-dependent methyltransferase
VNANDSLFAGSIPEVYDKYLVPLIFEPYAIDLSTRLAARSPAKLLELAAGTGVVTRRLALEHPATDITATDLNQPMLDRALSVGTARPVTWRQADAQALPFEDGVFDAVVCQFGAMFFPDKARAFSEARRVLKSGGLLLFNVWDRIAENEFAACVIDALHAIIGSDSSDFMTRVPHGYHERAAITRDVVAGGFAPPDIRVVAAHSVASSPRIPAIAFCQGTPLRGEIEARGPDELEVATGLAERALAAKFGSGSVDGRIQALVVAATR